jgi:hypothetical protein
MNQHDTDLLTYQHKVIHIFIITVSEISESGLHTPPPSKTLSKKSQTLKKNIYLMMAGRCLLMPYIVTMQKRLSRYCLFLWYTTSNGMR